MSKKPHFLIGLAAVAASLICFTLAQAKKPDRPGGGNGETAPYTLVELSAIDGQARAINQLGAFVEVVGYLTEEIFGEWTSTAHYWMVDPAGNILLSIDLPSLPAQDPDATVDTWAWDVNNQGVVVGYQWDGLDRQPLLWPDAASEPVELPLPEGIVGGAVATSINDAGIVVGTTIDLENGESLVAWKVEVFDGVAIVLDTKTILSVKRVHGVQVVNSGYVCATLGISTNPDVIESRAFRLRLDWDDEQVLEVVGSRTQLLDVNGTARGINEDGTGRGNYAGGISGGWSTAFVMTVSGELLELPVLPELKKKGLTYGETYNEDARALNNTTPVQIVGRGSRSITRGNVGATFQDSEKLPLRWDGETSITDLRTVTNGSSERFTDVTDINDAGWITARTGTYYQPGLPAVLIPSQ